jgi:Transposase DDE domain
MNLLLNVVRYFVKRGEILLDFDVVDNWESELEKMNEGKEGRKFVYPDSFIKLLGYIRVYFHLPYRQTDGIVRAHAANTLPQFQIIAGFIIAGFVEELTA